MEDHAEKWQHKILETPEECSMCGEDTAEGYEDARSGDWLCSECYRAEMGEDGE